MGRVNDSILSGTTGRTGRVVIVNLYGHEYSRIRPRRRTGEPTVKQQLIYQRLKNALSFMEPYRAYACKYFGNRVGVKSRYNMAMSNVLDAYTIDNDTQTMTRDDTQIAFAKGPLLGVIPVNLESVTPGNVTFEWFDNSGTTLERQDDQLQLLTVPENENDTAFFENIALRKNTTVTVNLTTRASGKTCHVWAAFLDPQSQKASNSFYLGAVTIQ